VGVFVSGIADSLDTLIFCILIRLKFIVGLVIVCPPTIGFTTPFAGDFVDNLADGSLPEIYILI